MMFVFKWLDINDRKEKLCILGKESIYLYVANIVILSICYLLYNFSISW